MASLEGIHMDVLSIAVYNINKVDITNTNNIMSKGVVCLPFLSMYAMMEAVVMLNTIRSPDTR